MTHITFTLPAGTVCQRNGLPFELTQDTIVECHPENWPLIRDEFLPGVGYIQDAPPPTYPYPED